MKIIQSFWTKPFLRSQDALVDSRLNGGWPARKYNYFSWALSCLQLKKHYDRIELITDDLGKFILIDKLGLPYTSVATDLNRMDDYDPGLWAMGKIYAYSLQKEAFLHVDSDIFIWRKFDDRIALAKLAAQNIESRTIEYAETFKNVYRSFSYIPAYLDELVPLTYISCSNAGILGGTDIDFFGEYTQEVFGFIRENRRCIGKELKTMNTTFFNVVYEQVIFRQLAAVRNRSIAYLFPDVDDVPRDIGFFHAADRNEGFVHCLGSYKRNRQVCGMLELNLKSFYPEFHERIVELMAASEI